MSEPQAVTRSFRRGILNDDSIERCKPEESIGQVQRHERLVQRFASVITLFIVLVMVGVGGMVAFAGLLMAYPKKLKRLRNARQVVKRRQDSHLGKPQIIALPGSARGSNDGEAFQGAAEVSGYSGSLDSPSWLCNRLCG
jgi:hypothetical protein